MDKLLENKLKRLSLDLDNQGFEEAFLRDLTAEDYMDLETLLSEAISKTEKRIEFQKLIQIRHLFRIIVKFHTDLVRGINRIREIEY